MYNLLSYTDKKTCKLRTDEDGGPVLFCNLPNVEDTEEDDELIPNIVSLSPF